MLGRFAAITSGRSKPHKNHSNFYIQCIWRCALNGRDTVTSDKEWYYYYYHHHKWHRFYKKWQIDVLSLSIIAVISNLSSRKAPKVQAVFRECRVTFVIPWLSSTAFEPSYTGLLIACATNYSALLYGRVKKENSTFYETLASVGIIHFRVIRHNHVWLSAISIQVEIKRSRVTLSN